MDNIIENTSATAVTSADTYRFTQMVAPYMRIEDTTIGRPGKDDYTIRFRGQLLIDSVEAYERLQADFATLNHTPVFRKQGDRHVVLAHAGTWDVTPANPWVNLVLAVLTIASVMWTGWSQAQTYDNPWPIAISYTVALLGILLAHEFGHYFAGQYHKAKVTLPYLIPLPGLIGTMGAVILMRAPLKNRRVLLDVGIAGPLAGLVVAIPVVIVGLSLSQISTIPMPPPNSDMVGILMEGNSLLYLFLKFVTFGQLLPAPSDYGAFGPVVYWISYFFTGQPFPYGAADVTIHPLAWAGWVGLLITGLNLLPAGQFDGGHVAYVLLGKNVKYLRWVILALLIPAGFFWQGWWLWAALILFMNRGHATVLDEITELDGTRTLIAWGMIIVFLLVFTPVPLVVG